MKTSSTALKRLRRALRAKARRIAWRLATGSLILTYHRVAEATTDPWELCVLPDRFEEQLETLRRRNVRILAMSELIKLLEAENPPPRAVVITFDDGYADNLLRAKPALQRFEAPATIFVSASYVGAPREFWWDELERILLQPGELPANLTLDLPCGRRHWTLGRTAQFSVLEQCRFTSWRMGEQPPTPRHAAYQDVWTALVSIGYRERESALAQLRDWAQCSALARDSHRILSEEELRRLSTGGLIEIGAHTMTHVSLVDRPLADKRSELEQSKARLESIVRRPVNGMSYPHGNYSPELLSLVQNAGYFYACASHPGLVRYHTDCLRMPRIPVGNWSGPQFERMLAI